MGTTDVVVAPRERLLLEEILEGLAGVVGPGGARRGLALDCYPGRVKGAIVPRVFLRDALRNRLSALEPARRVEIRALLAAVELNSALWAFAVRVVTGGEDNATIGATRNGVRSRHLRRPRADLFALWGRPLPGRSLPVGFHVAPLPILSFHECTSRPVIWIGMVTIIRAKPAACQHLRRRASHGAPPAGGRA